MDYPNKLVRTLSRRGFVTNTLGAGLALAVTSTSTANVLTAGLHTSPCNKGAEINVWTGWTEGALTRMQAVLKNTSSVVTPSGSLSLISDRTMRKQLLSVATHVDHGAQYFVSMSRSSTPPANELEARQQSHELGVWRVSVSTDQLGIKTTDAQKISSAHSQNADCFRHAIRVGSDYLCGRQNDLYFHRLLV